MTARLPSTDTEPPGIKAGVLDLSRVVSTGAVFDGEPVTEIVIKWAGGEMKATLRPPEPGDDGAAGTLRRRILDKLSEMEVAVSRKQLAKAMGRQSVGGRFSTEVSALLETSEILERDGLLTDDATKFPDAT